MRLQPVRHHADAGQARQVFHFGVVCGPLGEKDPAGGGAHRVADEEEALVARQLQDVIDGGCQVVVADLVVAEVPVFCVGVWVVDAVLAGMMATTWVC